MNERLIDRIPFAKIVAILAIVLGVSLGLCGVTAFLAFNTRSGGDFLLGFGYLELAAIVLSAVGLALTLVVFVTLWVFGGFSEKVSQPQKLFGEEDDTKIDKDA